ncbi:MAG: polysaccharide deacetylase family protein, partial [Burkholderiaceae bacterium]|nr:polysaccharide deacetylase family protein [Burkholderiaceae bacterium]
MSLPDKFFTYPHRSYGMDHDRYDWSILPQRKQVTWPGGARVALWINVALEWFPLNFNGDPIHPPGEFAFPYPDLRGYTLRDFGNRVGVYRVMKALDRYRIPATAAVNAAVAARYPALMEKCLARNWELIGHGLDMNHPHYEGMPAGTEETLIAKSVQTLQKATGRKVRGWLSPAKSESWKTLDLIAAAGIEYVCDWGNDDMPYAMRTEAGPLVSMPHPLLLDDWAILIEGRHSEDEFCDQICAQFDVLYRESQQHGGRVMALSLRPWVIGQPFRIGALEKALSYIASHKDV